MPQLPGTSQLAGKSQLPDTEHSLGFEVKSVASGGSAKTDQLNHLNPNSFPNRLPGDTLAAQGSVRSKENKQTLQVIVHNLAGQPDTVRFECYFVAKSQHKPMYVWDHSDRDIEIPAHSETTTQFASSGLVETVARETHVTGNRTNVAGVPNPIGVASSQTRTGAQPYGWIVRLTANGRILKVQASSATLEEIGRNQVQLDELLANQPPSAPGANRLPFPAGGAPTPAPPFQFVMPGR